MSGLALWLGALLCSEAAAGYGDPQGGYPSRSERWLHLWTNAARVAPEEFESEYRAGGCRFDDFSQDEQTAKDPLYLDYGLAEAARYHSEDMAENGCFQHESCDGTDTWDRIARYYSEGGAMGENIAMGGVDGKYAVLSMWMCSTSGHRANIMSGGFNELGVGDATDGGNNYFTQDFAAGSLTEGAPAVRMAADDGSGGFYADYAADGAPATMELVVDGQAAPMQRVHGTDRRGIWWAETSLSGDCQAWWIRYEDSAGQAGTFPESGAYQVGCSEDWIASRPSSGDGGDGEGDGSADPGGLDGASPLDDDIKLGGCSSLPGAGDPARYGAVGLALCALARRKVVRARAPGQARLISSPGRATDPGR